MRKVIIPILSALFIGFGVQSQIFILEVEPNGNDVFQVVERTWNGDVPSSDNLRFHLEFETQEGALPGELHDSVTLWVAPASESISVATLAVVDAFGLTLRPEVTGGVLLPSNSLFAVPVPNTWVPQFPDSRTFSLEVDWNLPPGFQRTDLIISLGFFDNLDTRLSRGVVVVSQRAAVPEPSDAALATCLLLGAGALVLGRSIRRRIGADTGKPTV